MFKPIELMIRGARNPSGAYRWLRFKTLKKLPMGINTRFYDWVNDGRFNDDGIYLLRQDWDNLIVLDACRWDLFENVSSLPGELSRVNSRETGTIRWLEANFNGGRLYDTVYVTANPQFERLRDQYDIEFHDVINVWREDGWDEELNTVHPETTAKYAERAAEDYPNKRLLIHFMQPHFPFIPAPFEDDKLQPDIDADNSGFWLKLNDGRSSLTRDELWEAYRENLQVALPYVEDLLTGLEGRNVVTSDHGNLIGERTSPIPVRYWGHPMGIYAEELVTVPWLEYTNGARKEVQRAEPAPEHDETAHKQVESRLKSLGYR
jgi:hypothetical protein